MKNLFLLLTCCLLSFSSYAQTREGRQVNEATHYQERSDNDVRMAGEHLQKYSRQFYIGTGLMVAGYTVASISLANAVVNQNTSGGNTVSGGAGITIGAFMLIGGAVVQLLSHRHIGKAGKLLEQSTLSHNLQLQSSPTGLGLGLAYRF
jgi:hypothetical protein